MSPKYLRYFKKTIPFAVIWLIFGLSYVLIEFGLLGRLEYYPTTHNPYNFEGLLLYTSIGTFFMGMFQGWIEIVWLRKRFEAHPLWVKILLKTIIYLVLIVLFLCILTLVNSIIYFHDGIIDTTVFMDLKRFISNFAFWSIVIYVGIALSFALFFSEVENYLGETVFYNFLLGRYHHPNEEFRIFMFLDMKSSTTIAESIGHKQYFRLLKMYYADMTKAILETAGEVYQYVGDEIVITWTKEKGLQNNNCIECFRKIESTFEKKKETYLQNFSLLPSFKAGYHIGEVTSGEIGILKKDIIYTGDVLNTTARIQAKCNEHDAKILISEDLKLLLPASNIYSPLGSLVLRGKRDPILLFSVEV